MTPVIAPSLIARSPDACHDFPLIIALDYPDMAAALAMADQLDPTRCRVKVGKELFTRVGPDILKALHQRGFEVFLDLKFHDIPNTTAQAVLAAAEHGVWMTNVHAGGGARMMEAAASALATRQLETRLIAVTVLTSMEQSDLAGIGLDVTPLAQVERLASLAQQSGMHGVVCSARETPSLKALCGPDFLKVTPGIRPSFAQAGDQRRTMTPGEAMAAGSTHLVIGRPVTQAENPMAALAAIETELGGRA
ncbi:orotidine-5'-phosphate decarboxylase [Cobetia marina]